MFFFLDFQNDIVKSDTLINLKWVEEICSFSSLCLIRVDDKTFCCSCSELCSIRTEANVFYAHSKFYIALK